MTYARRPAGAHCPASPVTTRSPAGAARPEAHTGRTRARRVSLLPALALLLGALSLLTAAPAQAQTKPVLTGLTLSISGTSVPLDQTFAGTTESYTATVPYGTASLSVTATWTGTGFTVKAGTNSTDGNETYTSISMNPIASSGGSATVSLAPDADATALYVQIDRTAGGTNRVREYLVTVNKAPAAPTGLTVTPGPTRLDLAWTASAGTVTGYDVHFTRAAAETVANDAAVTAGTAAAAGWVAVSRAGHGTTASHRIRRVLAGAAHRVRVRATNDHGAGPWAFGTGTPQALGLPTNLVVTPGNAQLALRWTRPDGDFVSYDVDYTSAPKTGNGAVADDAATSVGANAATHWVACCNTIVDDTENSVTIAGLANGTAYRVRLRTVLPDGAYVFGAGTPRPALMFGAQSAAAVEGENEDIQVTLSEALASDTTVSVAVAARGTATEGADFRLSAKTLTLRAGETTATLVFTALADFVREDGETVILDLSAPANAPYMLADPTQMEVTIRDGTPGAPANFTATPGDKRLDLAWTPTPGNPDGYDVHYRQLGASSWTDAGHTGTTAAHALTGLTNERGYQARVRWRHASDNGEWAAASGIPTAQTLTLSVDRQPAEGGPDVTLTAALGRAAVETRTLVITAAGTATGGTDPHGADWSAEPSQRGDGALQIPLSIAQGATSASATLKVTDDNEADVGETIILTARADGARVGHTTPTDTDLFPPLVSNTLTLTIRDNDAGPPGPPAGLTAAPGDKRLALAWTAPSDDVGSAVAGYDVHYTSALPSAVADGLAASGNDPAAGWVAVSRSGATAAQAITGLTNGATYRVRVRAENASGKGPWAHATGTPQVSAVPEDTLWSATFTPGDLGGGHVGCLNKGACDAALSDNSFTVGGAEFGFEYLTYNTVIASLDVRVDPDSNAALRALQFCSGAVAAPMDETGNQRNAVIFDSLSVGWQAGVPVEIRIGGDCAVIVPLSAPTNLRFNARDGALELKWDTPSAGAATGYEWEWKTADAPDAAATTADDPATGWVRDAFTQSISVSGADLTGLVNGTAYNVRVRAIGAGDPGPWAEVTGTPRAPGGGVGGGVGGGALSSANALASLSVVGSDKSIAVLDPAFDPDANDYRAEVAHAARAVTLYLTLRDDRAVPRVNGATVSPGQPSASIALKVGSNVIEITVTAETGAARRIVLTLVRAPAPAPDPSLPALTLTGDDDSEVTLSPSFDPDTTDYAASVAHHVAGVTVTPATPPGNARITVAGRALQGGRASAPLPLAPGQTAVEVTVTAADNRAARTYTVTLTRAVAPPAPDRRTLPELARALADDTQASIAARLEAGRGPAAPPPGGAPLARLGQALGSLLPGQALSPGGPATIGRTAFDPARSDARVDSGWVTPAASIAINWKALIDNADFVLPLSNTPADGEPLTGLRSLTLWSDGSYRNLSGHSEGLNWHGDLLGARLGAELRLSPSLTAGAAAGWQRAGWDTREGNSGLRHTLTLIGVNPYAGWTNDRLSAWASGGLGWGTLNSRRDGSPDSAHPYNESPHSESTHNGSTHREDVTTGALGGGIQGQLWHTTALDLRLKAEALLTGLDTETVTTNAHRLRLALEAGHTRQLGQTATLAPTLQLGLRHDGGHGQGGTGLELGGSLHYTGGPLTLRGQGRALIGRNGYKEWGIQGLAEWRARTDGRGLTLRLAPGLGHARSGIEQLWARGLREEQTTRTATGYRARLDLRLDYGWDAPHHRGRLTPYLEMQLHHATRVRAGTRWDAPGNLQLHLLGERNNAGAGAPADHALLLEGTWRF